MAVLTERKRGHYQDYADCIDDDYSVVDADDSVCDDNDGLTPEEIKAYQTECKILNDFRAGLRGFLGFFEWDLWTNPLNRWE